MAAKSVSFGPHRPMQTPWGVRLVDPTRSRILPIPAKLNGSFLYPPLQEHGTAGGVRSLCPRVFLSARLRPVQHVLEYAHNGVDGGGDNTRSGSSSGIHHRIRNNHSNTSTAGNSRIYRSGNSKSNHSGTTAANSHKHSHTHTHTHTHTHAHTHKHTRSERDCRAGV